MIQNGLLQVALCTQFLTGTICENTLPPEEYVEQSGNEQNIEVSVDGIPAVTELVVNETKPVEITGTFKAVYVDGECMENTSSVSVGPDNEVLAVETEKGDCLIYPVKGVEMVEADFSVGNGEYSINPDPELRFFKTVDEPVNAVLLRDGNPVQTVSCLNRDEIQFHLDETGTYGLYLEYERYASLRGRINNEKEIQFYYSGKEPSVTIEQAAEISEKGILIEVHGDGDDLQKTQIILDNKEHIEKYDRFDPIYLPVIEGKHTVYDIQAEVLDVYGRKAQDSLHVEIDRKPPVIQASYNQIPLENDQSIVISDLSLFSCEIEDAQESVVSVYINDQYISDSLFDIHPVSGDNIKIVIRAKDASQNEAVSRYLLEMISYQPAVIEPDTIPAKEPVKEEKKPETTTSLQMPILNRSDDYVEVVRDWSIDENQSVVLEHEKRSIIDHTKPFVCLLYPDIPAGDDLHAGDRARLTILNTVDYSNDCFSKIIINGETIDVSNLPRDDLNNQYWEFELKEGINTIEADAKDDSENTTVFHETVNAKKQKKKSFVWIIASVSAMGAVLLWIKKHVESLDS